MKNQLVLLMVGLIALSGCGKKADTNKPIEQVRAEAETMSVSDLEATAKAYAAKIQEKKIDVEKVKNQLSTLKPQEMLGDKAKGIKTQMEKIASEMSALSERYQVYAQKFQASGGDLSKIQI